MGRLSSTKDISSEKTRREAAKRDREAAKETGYAEKEVRTANEDLIERTVWDEV